MSEMSANQFIWENWDAYHANTKATTKNGTYSIECINGLWSVSAPTFQQAHNEAVHYFRQYWSDGEYNDTVKENLVDSLKAKPAE